MKDSNSFSENKEINLGSLEDKSLEEIICTIDACFILQESKDYGFDEESATYKLKTFNLLKNYLNTKGLGSSLVLVSQLLCYSMNDFEYLFNSMAISKSRGPIVSDYTYKLMEQDDYVDLLKSYREEKVNPIVLDIIKTLNLQKIR